MSAAPGQVTGFNRIKHMFLDWIQSSFANINELKTKLTSMGYSSSARKAIVKTLTLEGLFNSSMEKFDQLETHIVAVEKESQKLIKETQKYSKSHDMTKIFLITGLTVMATLVGYYYHVQRKLKRAMSQLETISQNHATTISQLKEAQTQLFENSVLMSTDLIPRITFLGKRLYQKLFKLGSTLDNQKLELEHKESSLMDVLNYCEKILTMIPANTDKLKADCESWQQSISKLKESRKDHHFDIKWTDQEWQNSQTMKETLDVLQNDITFTLNLLHAALDEFNQQQASSFQVHKMQESLINENQVYETIRKQCDAEVQKLSQQLQPIFYVIGRKMVNDCKSILSQQVKIEINQEELEQLLDKHDWTYQTFTDLQHDYSLLNEYQDSVRLHVDAMLKNEKNYKPRNESLYKQEQDLAVRLHYKRNHESYKNTKDTMHVNLQYLMDKQNVRSFMFGTDVESDALLTHDLNCVIGHASFDVVDNLNPILTPGTKYQKQLTMVCYTGKFLFDAGYISSKNNQLFIKRFDRYFGSTGCFIAKNDGKWSKQIISKNQAPPSVNFTDAVREWDSITKLFSDTDTCAWEIYDEKHSRHLLVLDCNDLKPKITNRILDNSNLNDQEWPELKESEWTNDKMKAIDLVYNARKDVQCINFQILCALSKNDKTALETARNEWKLSLPQSDDTTCRYLLRIMVPPYTYTNTLCSELKSDLTKSIVPDWNSQFVAEHNIFNWIMKYLPVTD
jgi:hypothetical protein